MAKHSSKNQGRRIRSSSASKRSKNNHYSISIPSDIAKLIPDDAWFDCELTEKGILFRRRVEESPKPLPDWISK